MTARWERYAPLAGVVAIVLWLVAVWIIEGVGDTPGDDATPQEFLAYYEDEEGSIYGGTFVFALGSLAFLWFVATLRELLAAGEGAAGRWARIAFAGGVATFVISLALGLGQLGGVFAAGEENFAPEAAQALWYAYDGFFVAAAFTAIPLVLATGLVTLRTGVLPRWWGWISVLVALSLLVYPLVWIALIFVFPAWVIVTSVLLWRAPGAGPPAPAPAAATPLE